MTRFYFNPDEFQIPPLKEVAVRWANIPDPEIKSMIVVENQYLDFHLYALDALHFKWEHSDKFITGKISYSVRAGAVKAAVLLQASIAEAAMRCHAEARGYKLPPNPMHRTFGKICEAWEKAGYAELSNVWEDIQSLNQNRRLVHLYRAAEENNDFRELLKAEDELLARGKRVLKQLQNIHSNP